MKKLSKNPIDQYFRENLRSPDLEYNKQDWKGLEKMLPANQKRKNTGWWLPSSIAAAVALLFISLWLFNNPNITTDKAVKNNVNVSRTDKSSIGEERNTSTSKALSKSKSLPTTANSSNNTTKNVQQDLFSSNSSAVNFPKPDNTNEIGERTNSKLAISPVPFSGVLKFHHQEILYAGNVDLSNFNVLIPPSPDQKTNSKDPKENLNSRFSLALSVSPDINSISKFSESRFGNSVSLSLNYQLAPRLSVNTGVAYSKKVYSAEPYQYKAPWAYSSAGRNATAIDADCRVLDIPLNFNYNFIESPKRTIFASAGVSSYFMLEEKYTLVTGSKPSGYPAYPDLSYDYENENQHILSVVNFSVGIAKPISKQTSLVVEPYMRLPVTGIGQGKVHLKSIGLNLQFKYNFKKSRLNKTNPVADAQ